MIHELKTDRKVFDDVARGVKTFEIRYNDRGYQVRDRLVLRKTEFTGKEMGRGAPLNYLDDLQVVVTYILRGPIYGLADGWVIMGIEKHTEEGV